MLNLKLIFSIVTLLASFSALCAYEIKDDCHQFKNFKRVIIADANNKYITCNRIKELDHYIDRVNEIISAPKKINLLIRKYSNNASFDHGQIINVPNQIVFHGKYGQIYQGAPYALRAIFIHEYAHAVFSNILKEINILNDFITMSERLSDLRLSLVKTSNKENKDEINKEIKKLSDAQKETIYYKHLHMITSYNELYADIIAGFITDDKYSITDALYYDEISDLNYSLIQARSFNQRSSIDPHVLREPHALFAKTRSFIGENFWPKSDEEIATHLEFITQEIIKSIEENLNQGVKRLNPEQANMKLIQRLKEKGPQ